VSIPQACPQPTRRGLLKTGAGVGVGGILGGGIYAARPTAPAATFKPVAAAAAALTHPGLLHTQADFDRMAAKVTANAQPWTVGWDRLIANSHSQSTWKANPQATVYRGSGNENYTILYNDIAAAYQNALRWKITGSTAYGNAARDILNAWSGTLTTVTGDCDRFLASGIYGYEFANAAEVMRGYSGFDLARFQTMMCGGFDQLGFGTLTCTL
jgi:hypothetical protein